MHVLTLKDRSACDVVVSPGSQRWQRASNILPRCVLYFGSNAADTSTWRSRSTLLLRVCCTGYMGRYEEGSALSAVLVVHQRVLVLL